MAKKKIEAVEPQKSMLIMPCEQFKQTLEQRIELGKKLFEIKVTRNAVPYGAYGHGMYNGYVSQEERQYNKQEIEAFKKEFNKWSDYNSELLKQAFDNPENEYRREYDVAGAAIILMGNEDVMEDYYNRIKERIAVLERLIEKLPLLPKAELGSPMQVVKRAAIDQKKVFIVHGHDANVRNEVEIFIRDIGYEPIILCKRADIGNTIIEKIEREAQDVCFAIVIYTSCDLGRDKNAAELKPRARQNVVFEHGFMCARLGRERVCALLEDGVEQPGDLQGVIYKPLDAGGAWKYQIADEMKAVGLDVDKNRI